jgi:xylan 1,4-beta-xylosidase
LPLHWTEWNTQLATCAGDVTWGENRHVDSLHGASFVARQMVELDDAADSFMYWVASDLFEEGPLPQTPFSQTYGLLTIHGVPKAAANAFRLLERLRGPRARVEWDDPTPFCGAVATCEGTSVHVLAWHDLPPGLAADPWSSELQITPPESAGPADTWVVTSAHIRAGQGSPLELWESLGSPANLSAAQLACLRSRAEPARDAVQIARHGGDLRFAVCLEAQLGERSRL